MPKIVKYTCKKCKHIELFNKWEELGYSILSVFLVLGMLSTAFMVVIGPIRVMNIFSSAMMTRYSQQDMETLRHFALNYTTFDGYDAFLFAEDLLLNMPDMRYVGVGQDRLIYDNIETLNYGGDCKGLASFFSATMNSVGYTAYVDCNVAHHHCVSKIPEQFSQLDFGDRYLIVDLAADNLYLIYNNTIDHWENPDAYEYAMYVNNVGGDIYEEQNSSDIST